MKCLLLVPALALSLNLQAQAPPENPENALVSIEVYEKLIPEVKKHRSKRLLSLEEFVEMSREKNVIILDARSEKMYAGKHIKGAVNLNFSDFTQENLAELIPDRETRILIYCNNNFSDDDRFFATKAYVPPLKSDKEENITLALNIPTYINLFGYGYRNIYELKDLVSVYDPRIELEGTAVD